MAVPLQVLTKARGNAGLCCTGMGPGLCLLEFLHVHRYMNDCLWPRLEAAEALQMSSSRARELTREVQMHSRKG